MRRLSLEKSLTVVAGIHEINMVAQYCDEIFALKGGRMIAHGPADEFMTATRLEEIYDVAMGVLPNPDSGGTIAYVRA